MGFPNTSDDLNDLVGIELTGTQANRYMLGRRIGGGAQGCAFAATRTVESGQDAVVVKVWRPSFVLTHPDLAKMVLKKEYVALARLNDAVPSTPFVVRLLDGGELEVIQRFTTTTLPWLALEYVHGGVLGTTLRDRVRQSIATTGFAFPPERAARVLGCVVRGMLAIHEAGVVHRDLKPTNVLVCGVGTDELAKVADFGLARPLGLQSTFGKLAVGTPGYAAPEQLEGERVGPWSDVFSLAAIAYFVVTGEEMFYGTPVMQLANAYSGNFFPLATRPHVHPAWKTGTVPAQIDAVLQRATRRDLSARTASVGEFWAALEPPLRDAESQGRHSLALGTARTLHDASAHPWTFRVAHKPPMDLELTSVAFDPDGHALACGAKGLWYWEGARWIQLQPPSGIDPRGVRLLRRLGPTRWFACGDRGMLHVFTPYAREVSRSVGDGVCLTTAALRSERDFAVAGLRGAVPYVYPCVGGEYRAPVAIDFAEEIAAIAPFGDDGWCIAGRDGAGRGVLATMRADATAIERWPVDSAPLLAAVEDSSGATFVVGAGGFAFRKKEGHAVLERVMTHRNLTVASIDPGDGIWAAAIGRIVYRPPDSSTWSVLWSDASWSSAFVSIEALSGMVIAASHDGSLVVGRQEL